MNYFQKKKMKKVPSMSVFLQLCTISLRALQLITWHFSNMITENQLLFVQYDNIRGLYNIRGLDRQHNFILTQFKKVVLLYDIMYNILILIFHIQL